MNLNDLQCRSATAREKPYKLYDQKGLYLEISPTGYKSWRYRYHHFGKEKRVTLGDYPFLSLADARQKRDDARNLLKNGQDPAIVKKHKKQTAKYKANQTLELVGREWYQYNLDTWGERHAADILYRLEMDIFPDLGAYPITEITPAILFHCIQKIEARGAHELARRAMQYVGRIFRYGASTGRGVRDITVDLKGTLKRFERGHFAAIEVDELKDFAKAIYRNETRIYPQTILAIRFMLLTFVRTNELIKARWDEIDWNKEQWIVSAGRMKKVGTRKRREHIVPLSKQAIALLKPVFNNKAASQELIFPSIPKPKQPMSNATILSGLDKLGYKGIMTGHGFRALAMSAIKEKLKYRHEVIDRQLAHIPKSKVDQAYDRAKFLDERKQMMQDWADYLDTLVQQPSPDAKAKPIGISNVIQLNAKTAIGK
ncbi:tyrosine-type recombinase/integrase [Taibaiella koreensis]|uniref:tyrosine-type recombinase/integrase n=1 Tax=Taibaiella koreensis TaxID=1268548 RepID=UPI000E5A048F|nr:integrase arm-type DNA-binding domain-containing protein [Taibaiella koreensis]